MSAALHLPLLDWPALQAAEEAVHAAHENFAAMREAWIRAPYGQKRAEYKKLQRANLHVLKAELHYANLQRGLSQ